MSHPSLAYRPEIDGLRALAVLPVLLYHAGFGFPGGFAGVDVFFVISGYLIGSVIVRETEEGSFRLPAFWLRRLRRLFPALATVVSATLAAGFLWLVPAHLRLLGESVAGQFVFAANFQFWKRSGYFDPASEHFPLLHTWSLAVEEQFYLLLPLVLVPLLRRWGRKAAMAVVAAFIAASLLWCLHITVRDPGMAFYLLPSRIWELDLGLLLALWGRRGFGSVRADSVGSLLGLGAIAASYFLYDAGTPYPGSAALLPCLGTVLFLFCNSGGLAAGGRWLAHPAPVWVGKVSYPLYLWHWPCLVFLGYVWINPSASMRAGALLLSLVLAWATWRWIEEPVRRRRVLASTKRLVAACGTVAALLFVAGLLVYQKDGFPDEEERRASAEARSQFAVGDFYGPADWERRGGPPLAGAKSPETPKVLLWGDSHAMSAVPVLDDLGKEFGVTVYVAWSGGTPPILGARGGPSRGKEEIGRAAHERRMLDLLEGTRFDAVLFVARWPMYIEGHTSGRPNRDLLTEPGAGKPSTREEAARLFLKHFPATIAHLESRGAKVYVMQNVGMQPVHVQLAFSQTRKRGKRDINDWALTLDEHRKRNAGVAKLLGLAVDGTGAVLLDPMPLFTDERGVYLMAKDGEAFYSDTNHLSPAGARQLRPLLEPIFRGAAGRDRTER